VQKANEVPKAKPRDLRKGTLREIQQETKAL
jgi:hypothetical protein